MRKPFGSPNPRGIVPGGRRRNSPGYVLRFSNAMDRLCFPFLQRTQLYSARCKRLVPAPRGPRLKARGAIGYPANHRCLFGSPREPGGGEKARLMVTDCISSLYSEACAG